ncbi:MAG: AtpZ/AtpI family protein [Caldilineaceae bacterium]
MTQSPNGQTQEEDRLISAFRHVAQEELIAVVAEKEARKLQARRAQGKSIWFGLGMFGMIGWSVSVPILLALVLGTWLDQRWPTRFSWTLTLLFMGVVLGCLNAWFWVIRERALINVHDANDEEASPPDHIIDRDG